MTTQAVVQADPYGPQCVLAAEDDSVVRTILHRCLGRWGYHAQIVNDGPDAWRALQEEHCPRLVLLDWMMPGMDGIEICRRIRGLTNDSYFYVIVITSKNDKSDVVAALDAGADDYITKPFDLQELRARLATGARIVSLQQELLLSQEQLRIQATRDSLTGLRNRRSITESLQHELDRGRRTGRPVGVMMLDLDRFKTINDTYGHLAGDVVLAETARRICSVLRSYDAVGRFGGEEFLVVLPDCTADVLAAAAERVRRSIAASPMLVGETKIDASASIGTALASPDESAGLECFIRRADEALYEAKGEGRNCCVAWRGECQTRDAEHKSVGNVA